MATRRPSGTRNEMIHCENCGEDYAATYRRCPFCEGRPLDELDYDDIDETSRGGRRLATNTRGGGYGGSTSPVQIVGTVLSLALIVAAVCIVISIVKPLVEAGKTPPIDPNTVPSTVPSQAVQSPTQAVEPSAGPSTAPVPSDTVVPPATAVPAGQAASFTLSTADFTMNDKYPTPVTIGVTFVPAGSTGTITWSSSDPQVAAVDANGKVSAGGKNGTAIITASLEGGGSQQCQVRCSFSGALSSGNGTGTENQSTSSSSLSLNKTDFTFSSLNETPVPMRVIGTDSTPTWSIGNTSVASISADGVVKPVGRGTTKITCTVDGQTLTCIVRCNF